MPFFAEEKYQKLRRDDMPESVHLLDWPKADKRIDRELEEKMARVRGIVALALAERAKVGIKVRQPLPLLKIRDVKIKLEGELLGLIKDEVNVKEIVFNEKLEKEIELDVQITPEQKEEGTVRDIIRSIQKMRKEAGLMPEDEILVNFSGDKDLEDILWRNKEKVLSEGRIRDLAEGKESENKVKIGGKEISIEIKKI
jgi:isoleucyl-tRNA synthetase